MTRPDIAERILQIKTAGNVVFLNRVIAANLQSKYYPLLRRASQEDLCKCARLLSERSGNPEEEELEMLLIDKEKAWISFSSRMSIWDVLVDAIAKGIA